MKVVGVDILPHSSPNSSIQARYAVVILDNGQVTAKYPNLRFNDLLKIIFKEHPDIVATDNVFELAKDKDELLELLRRLCLVTDVVQVTMTPDSKTLPLYLLAKREGIEASEKLSPIETAEVVARLAYKGVGCRLKVYEEKTKIIVSRARTLKAGGMSRARYQRHICTLILRVARKIKDTLDKHGFDYDLFYRKGPSGMERCLFIVYAPRRSLVGLIKPMKGHDIVVRISPIERQDIAFEPLKAQRPLLPSSHKYLVVGIDPGIVTGLAIIDIDGAPVCVTSKRYLSRSDIISIIYEYGTPVLIATDVDKPPTMVKKLASMLNVPIFVPSQTLCIAEKEKLVDAYLKSLSKIPSQSFSIKDSHQRDALAAALKAYNHFKPKFDQAREKLRELGLDIPFKDVKALIMRGRSVNDAIQEVVKRASQRPSPKPVNMHHNVLIIESLKRRLYRQAELILRLNEEREMLISRINELKRRIDELETRLNEISNEQSLKLKENKTLIALKRQIDELRSSLTISEREREALKDSLRHAIELLHEIAQGKVFPVKYIRALTLDSVKELSEREGIQEGDVIFVNNVAHANEEAVKILSSHNILGLISTDSPPEHVMHVLKSNEVALIVISKDKVSWFQDVVLVEGIEEIKRQLKKVKNELRKLSRRDKLRAFKRILNEYRSGRVKELATEDNNS